MEVEDVEVEEVGQVEVEVDVEDVEDVEVVLNNGTVEIIITKPGGYVAGVKYRDMNWNVASGSDTYDLPSGTIFQLVHSDGDKVTVFFTRPYDLSRNPAMVPLKVDKEEILLKTSEERHGPLKASDHECAFGDAPLARKGKPS
ncbi:hypothetical protein AXG93_4489s1030 [Marchantia polymorpha subsp. ruderalis]|uniref:Uncharacterized protein n=1 Tax=Marchantia polymorpha subsp. ruderalis TaxID=1480154 RepID=A0A176VSN8_MARPO|nr:hypothetical protein AXG93_4489s1030 [Marchantia polymorpha subsp. ruderalis]